MHLCMNLSIKDNHWDVQSGRVAVTSPVQPHSERPRSIQDPPGISSSADSASHRPVYSGAGLHHQTASPGVEKQVTCGTSDREINVIGLCVCIVLHSYHHIDAVFLQWRFIVRDVTDANHCGGTEPLQILKRVKQHSM